MTIQATMVLAVLVSSEGTPIDAIAFQGQKGGLVLADGAGGGVDTFQTGSGTILACVIAFHRAELSKRTGRDAMSRFGEKIAQVANIALLQTRASFASMGAMSALMIKLKSLFRTSLLKTR